jgi:hypothetical protein
MDLPRKYPYNAKLSLVILGGLMFGGASYFFIDTAIHNDRGLIINHIIPLDTHDATIFYWVLAALSVGFVIVLIMALIRRYSDPKFLELDETCITLPHGMLQRELSRIDYCNIVGLSETKVSRQTLLHLHTRERKYTLAASLLPNKKLYEEIRDFLATRMAKQQ